MLSTPKIFLKIALVSGLILGGVHCGSSNTPSTSATPAQPGTVPGTVVVTIPAGATGKGPDAYGQNPLNVLTGTTVRWTNGDLMAHSATSTTGVFDSKNLDPGQSFSFQFTQAGTFPYFCSIHGAQSMSGTIVVGSASPTPSPTPNPSATATPVAVSIPANSIGKGTAAYGVNPVVIPRGTEVTWTNNDSVAHTVTSDVGAFDSGNMGTGATFSHRFDTAGDFPYHCQIHGKTSMSGTMRVQ